MDSLRVGRLSAIRESGDWVVLVIDGEQYRANWPDIRTALRKQGIGLGDQIEFMVNEYGDVVSIGYFEPD